jgi:hypothetical protein
LLSGGENMIRNVPEGQNVVENRFV